MIRFFWKAIVEAFRLKQSHSRFCQLEGIGIPLRSGLVILNSATIQGKINPTDSVILSFTGLSKGRDWMTRSTTGTAFQKNGQRYIPPFRYAPARMNELFR
ncbi:hypothetical protein H9N25_01575 [Pedobacter riviphilus]|uniref:Uncharacterized protein n=1 Tax=Pedobacter riviphilus TaxID=2766984 RepID=A0ABX6TIS5_9SPHI|nr:hypothetical protein [Pedobacter riviphilus]QNR85217.1 hypothetical protein H9N25_01575 [Pedobacter riviphilus]